MSHSAFLAIAKDPTIIPGVHHHCDEWCDCCLVTNRCLEFSAPPSIGGARALLMESRRFGASTRLSRSRGR